MWITCFTKRNSHNTPCRRIPEPMVSCKLIRPQLWDLTRRLPRLVLLHLWCPGRMIMSATHRINWSSYINTLPPGRWRNPKSDCCPITGACAWLWDSNWEVLWTGCLTRAVPRSCCVRTPWKPSCNGNSVSGTVKFSCKNWCAPSWPITPPESTRKWGKSRGAEISDTQDCWETPGREILPYTEVCSIGDNSWILVFLGGGAKDTCRCVWETAEVTAIGLVKENTDVIWVTSVFTWETLGIWSPTLDVKNDSGPCGLTVNLSDDGYGVDAEIGSGVCGQLWSTSYETLYSP